MRLESLSPHEHPRHRPATPSVAGRFASRRPPGPRALAAAAMAIALLAACGSSKPSASTDTTSTPTSAEPTTSTLPVPTGFAPVSVTFVSSDQGFVLGALTCASSPTTTVVSPTTSTRRSTTTTSRRSTTTTTAPANQSIGCPAVAATDDGGDSWRAVSAPATTLVAGATSSNDPSAVSRLRFGDHLNGWAFGPGLWATHDGGETWAAGDLGGTVTDLASADGVTYAVVSHCTDGPCGQGATLYRTDAGTDGWTPVDGVTLSSTGGQITLHARAVWITGAADGTGHNLLSSSADGVTWAVRPDPCASGVGLVGTAPVTTTDLFVLCTDNAAAGSESKFVGLSNDAGQTVQATLTGPGSDGIATAIAAASPQVVAVVASSGASWIYRSTNGGVTWTTAVQQNDGGAGFRELGFTTATQGVVIHGQVDPERGGGTQLLMTTDAGETWQPVTFT